MQEYDSEPGNQNWPCHQKKQKQITVNTKGFTILAWLMKNIFSEKRLSYHPLLRPGLETEKVENHVRDYRWSYDGWLYQIKLKYILSKILQPLFFHISPIFKENHWFFASLEKQAEKFKSREMKDEGWKMNDECWKMKDEGWKMKDECWKMKDSGWRGFWGQTNRQTDICDFRVAFATENYTPNVHWSLGHEVQIKIKSLECADLRFHDLQESNGCCLSYMVVKMLV